MDSAYAERGGKSVMDKRIDELAWRDFEKSGHAGTYLLYKALRKQDEKDKD